MAQSFELVGGAMTVRVADWLPVGAQMALVGPAVVERGGGGESTRHQVVALASGQMLRGLFEIGPVQMTAQGAFCPVRLVSARAG